MASTSFTGASPGPLGRPPLSPAAQQLPKLVQETELQKMLADERMRSQLHKTNYEQLKEEHKRLVPICCLHRCDVRYVKANSVSLFFLAFREKVPNKLSRVMRKSIPLGFLPGLTQTSLYSHRERLQA